jgi:hypothetical protein
MILGCSSPVSGLSEFDRSNSWVKRAIVNDDRILYICIASGFATGSLGFIDPIIIGTWADSYKYIN